MTRTTLFTWDTTSGFLPLDYPAVLLDVGDPTGNEQAGLASDIAAYLPSRDAWVDLRQYSTTQRLTHHRRLRSRAVGASGRGKLGPGAPVGATAITIEGTRHRAGVWNEEPGRPSTRWRSRSS